MRRRHELIPSRFMGRRMNVWCYGHWGAPLLVVPSAAGFAHEWDAQGMLEALGSLVTGARLKLYCPESNVSESWTSKEASAEEKVNRYKPYERFVVEELVPWIRQDCGSKSTGSSNIRVAVSGASLGGYYAANFALKFPEIFHYALCLSGRYDITEFTDGQSNADIYFNNPLAYVPNLNGEFLERVRRNTHLALVCGQGPYEEGCIEETIALANVLSAKGISHERDIWGHDVSHNWVWWQRQARLHLTKTFWA